jgi:uncharacterized damage-inducible protein DinB
MYAKDIIKQTLDTSDRIARTYVGDLDQSEMTARPAAGMNPIAWQLGHLLAVEKKFVDEIKPGSSPALPAGFEEAHGKDAGLSDDTSKYLTKDEYLSLFAKQREATKKVLDSLTDAEMATPPANTFGGMCPTTGHLINFLGSHVMMHVGQFVPVRRKAGKPVVI